MAVEVVVPAEGEDFGRVVEAVEIDVDDRGAGGLAVGVFVDEAVGGAYDVVGSIEGKGLDDAFGERGFARAEVADEQDEIAGLQLAGEEAAGLDGVVRAMRGDEHRAGPEGNGG